MIHQSSEDMLIDFSDSKLFFNNTSQIEIVWSVIIQLEKADIFFNWSGKHNANTSRALKKKYI